MASLSFSDIAYADIRTTRLVRAVEVAVQLLDTNCRPEALKTALENALRDFHKIQPKGENNAVQARH